MPEPSRASSNCRGALPGRKPGILTSRASLRNAESIAFSNSAAGTSTLILTLFPSSVSTEVVRDAIEEEVRISVPLAAPVHWGGTAALVLIDGARGRTVVHVAPCRRRDRAGRSVARLARPAPADAGSRARDRARHRRRSVGTRLGGRRRPRARARADRLVVPALPRRSRARRPRTPRPRGRDLRRVRRLGGPCPRRR